MAFQYAEAIQKLYVAFFNRPADYYGLQYWDGVVAASKTPDAVIASLAKSFSESKEYTDTYAGQNNRQIINNIYKNLFGRPAEEAGLEYWNAEVSAGRVTLSNAVLMISGGAQNADKIAYASKVTAATSFTNALDTTDERLGYAGEKANAVAKQFIAGVTDAASLATAITPANLDATVNASIGAGQTATTYQLTKGLDNIPGTSGNDVIVGSIDATAGSELNTLSSIDLINGGAGVDTLKIAHASGAIALGSLTNVEVVEITSAYNDQVGNTANTTPGVVVDTTATTGVTDLNIVRAADAIQATAGAVTNVGVSLKDNAAIGTITVIGGKNVNVATTDSVSAINVGAGDAVDPVGAVTISATGAAAVNNVATTTMGTITVGGGTTINVTQKASVNTAGLVADGTKEKVVQGAVNITASAATTDVVVKADAQISSQSHAAVVGATEVATVKFTALKAKESVTVGGLTFTAAKDLTAAQVAQAFANLSDEALTPTQIAGKEITDLKTATGDTNGSSVASNGIFSGSLVAGWHSGAVTGDTVTFTAWEDTDIADLEASEKATAVTTTQGVDAVSAQNRLGIDTNTVTIAGGAALKNVTVDGYAASTGTAGITGDSNTALATVTLANGKSFDIDSAAANTLALNLTAVDGTVTVGEGAKTLNASVTTSASVSTILASADTETLNVTGSGNVAGSTASGLAKATAINTSGMTGGTATFTVADGTTTSYTGGAASDRVTVSNADKAITKAITLGAGNDRLILEGTVVVPTATLSGGEGVDQIRMNGASAESLSKNGDFAAKIDGFERLYITDTVATTTSVNMANMDGITYVISKNSVAGSADPVKEVFTLNTTNAAGAEKIEFNGLTVTLNGTETAAQIAAKFFGQSSDDYVVTGVNNNVVTFEARDAGKVDDVKATDVVVTNDATTAAVVVSNVVNGTPVVPGVEGAPDTPGTNETFKASFATSGAIENADTITFNGVKITLASGMTPAQIAAAVADAEYADWDAVVDGTTNTTVNFTAKTVGDKANVTNTSFAIVNVKPATAPSVALNVVTQGADAGAELPALTIDKMVNDSTLELVEAGGGVIVKMADATGTADTFNIVTTTATKDLNFGNVIVAGVETIKINAVDSALTDANGNAQVDTAILTVSADKATTVNIAGSSHLDLTLGEVTKSVATVDASAMTGDLTFAASGADGVVKVTVTGGSGNDTLWASTGEFAKADVLNGGAGNDVLYVGSNGAKLTGGEGNDTFVVAAGALTDGGTKEGNTYSEITDFKAGDLLQLQAVKNDAFADVSSLGKLAATLNETTANFSNFVNAAVKEAAAGAAVWFNYKGDLYVVVDSGTESTDTFDNGQDIIVKLTGINGDDLTWNSDFGTAALI